jgi:hypothetical protein
MNRMLNRVGAYALTSALCLATVGRLSAQTTSSTADMKSADDEKPIALSPFLVDTTEDAGYTAKNTLAGTRVRTELKDVGSAISVVTAKFLQDTNSKNSADLLVYTTGTEVAGQGGNFVGGGDGSIIADGAYTKPVANTRVRGLAEADNLRDFFLTDIPWDSYNVGRVDLQRGPNSILFGIGSPAGIINSSVNSAAFKSSNKVELQVSDLGSTRASGDFNQVILKNELAVRLAAVRDDTKYKQKPAFRDDHRVFGALRYEPRFFSKNGAHTSFRANAETGTINGINPRATPPIDAITPWFDSMSKATYAWQNSNEITDRNNARYSPYVGPAGGRIYDGNIVTFSDPGSSTQGIAFAASPYSYPTGQPTTSNDPSNGSYRGITTYNNIAQNQRLPGFEISPYKAKSLTDASIFDFYNKLIEGKNRSNTSEFDTYNLNLNQTFLDNKLGFELAYDHQDTKWGFRNFLAWDAAAITVDIMRTLIDGSPNPNVGRAMVIGGGGSAGSGSTHRIREAVRGTAFGELDFKDVLAKDSLITRFLGRHVATWSASQQSAETTNLSWNNWFVGTGYAQSAAQSVGQSSRDAATLTYLSGPLTNVNSASGLNLAPITARQEASSTTIRNWDTVSQSYVNYALPIVNPNSDAFNEANRPYTQASKAKDEITSQTFVWQGYLFEGNLVPMVGWRKDVAENFDAGSPNKVNGLVTNYADPEWRLPSGQSEGGTGKNKERIYSNVTGQTHTYSIVGHLPKSLASKLPWGMNASLFYSKSANFQPDASRKDILGNRIASPTGETKDYGFTLSGLDGRVSLKVNRYRTAVSTATLSGELSNSYLIGAGEAWGNVHAKRIGRDIAGLGYDSWENFGTTSAASSYGAGKVLRWEPARQYQIDPTDASKGYTQAGIDEQYAIMRKSVEAWNSNPIPKSMQDAWGMTDYATGGGSWSMNSVAVTGDTLSEGTEFELAINPVKGLNIAMNASKTDAKRLNIGKAYSDWIEQRYKDYQGPLGDMRMWGGGNWALDLGSGGTVRDKFNNETYPAYKLALALNNSNVPELRPWRFNTVANYDFSQGLLKGASLGGSYRWQDKNVTGFRLNAAKDGYDVGNPYYGPREHTFDMWIGYSRALTKRIHWRVQLNVRDLFASKRLIPVTVQPDGSPAAYKIPEPRVISLTNTFEF